APRLREHVLRHFLRIALIADDSQRQRIHDTAVPVVKLGERLVIAGRHPLERGSVRVRRHVNDGPEYPHEKSAPAILPYSVSARPGADGAKAARERIAGV